ncbi:hypothetical protein CQ018_12200 [Arthrobacter sp. MYb227]|uniref:bifunctional glycosyltransferase/CDP-glycerol:glycerophosphate glycerophosphotransferase n=1 Tax=Arthrobacter sp. MYb227 TaxID=1848601 RepID=UPI000CFCCDB6|nr:CDP-glycerol glycerophosphotransferase family protein [Arthrobacter sp. MYb227]PQZ92259.1 hypothetical protein CQ018_12200 [Arthrobacter sp. MYb227]
MNSPQSTKRTPKTQLVRRGLSKAKRIAYNAVYGFPNSHVRNQGIISVIVPCYNVEPYLEKCLRSILDQDYPYIEVVVVDDGSPDNSYEIARRVAKKDRRVKIVRQLNKGLGGARNTGVASARGSFITFVDPDDTISKSGYLKMVQTLHRTNSDFVVGTMQRQLGSKRWIPKWAQAVHGQTRLRAVLADDPSILQDVFACNKLFRKSFWESNVGKFPERIRYEDQKPTAIAYSTSSSFDVIPDVVYTWVIREDGSSITQGKANIEDLQDRLKVKQSVKEVLANKVHPDIFNYWQAKAIGFDLESYFEQIPRTNETYWQELQAGVRELATGMDLSSWSQVSFHNRAKAQAAIHGNREDIAIILSELQENGRTFEISRVNGKTICSADYLDRLSFRLADEYREASSIDLLAKFRISSATWTPSGDLKLCGLAYVPGFTSSEDRSLTLSLTSDINKDAADLDRFPTKRIDVIDADVVVGDAYASHISDGFECVIPYDWFVQAVGSGNNKWQAKLHLEALGLTLSGNFDSRSNFGNAFKFNHAPLIQGSRLAITYNAVSGIEIRATAERPIIAALSVTGREAKIALEPEYFGDSDKSAAILELSHPVAKTVIMVRPDTEGSFSFSVSFPELDQRYLHADDCYWNFRAGVRGGPLNHLQIGQTTEELHSMKNDSDSLVPVLSPNGYLRMSEVVTPAFVQDLQIEEGGLKVTVSAKPSDEINGAHWVLVSTSGHRIQATVTRIDDETLCLIFSTSIEVNEQTLSQPSGGYSLRLVNDEFSYWLPVSPGLADSFPIYSTSSLHNIRATRTPKAGALWISIDAPLGWEERGRFAKRSLIREVRAANLPIANATLFESYGGKNCSDSPLEISKKLLEQGEGGIHYWTVKDGSIAVPNGTVPVVLESRLYHEVLSSAAFLVNNNNFPYYFAKRPGQTYIQTWHGTPLKKIGNDVPGANLSVSYRELMKREAASWDLLIAQNDFSAEQLPKSFGYEGRTITSGYPRNDVLNSTQSAEIRLKTRSQLGIQDDELAVLYAPTWRDNQKTESNQYKLVSYLNATELQGKVATPVKVLLRGHSNTAQGRSSTDPNSIIDVTDYPDVNDLYLACDVLITDYSSVMFDYVNTGKPILYLVPDLESYAGEVRGFYLDFEAIAPGPLARSTSELATWLSDLQALNAEFSEKYEVFANEFTRHDDGNASERISDEWAASISDAESQ